MMKTKVKDNIIKAVILDISGVYVQIYDQGYFTKNLLIKSCRHMWMLNIGD